MSSRAAMKFAKPWRAIFAAVPGTCRFLRQWRRRRAAAIRTPVPIPVTTVMRSNPADYEVIAPGTLPAVLSLLASEPGKWLPIAGGTDVMVQYAAGTLRAKKLVSIWNLPELRRVEVLAAEIQIGAGCTYTDLREHAVVKSEFPLLSQAASWIGGISNQNRGTLGGNIANASPAGDSLPALLAYGAELILISVRGERRVAYREFHLGYKKTAMAADELIRAIYLP